MQRNQKLKTASDISKTDDPLIFNSYCWCDSKRPYLFSQLRLSMRLLWIQLSATSASYKPQTSLIRLEK